MVWWPWAGQAAPRDGLPWGAQLTESLHLLHGGKDIRPRAPQAAPSNADQEGVQI